MSEARSTERSEIMLVSFSSLVDGAKGAWEAKLAIARQT